MKPILLFLPLFILVMISIRGNARADQWELEMDKDGVRVYTQLDESSPYKRVKVTTTINAPREKVMEILMSFSTYKSWMNRVEESYLLHQSDSAYYVFMLESATWPMQNRYQVSRLDVMQTASNSHVMFRSIPNYIEKRADAIQIRQYEGYWDLQDRPDQHCSLEYVLIQHPGGHVPPWLANFHVTENPFHSITHLKALAEKESIRP